MALEKLSWDIKGKRCFSWSVGYPKYDIEREREMEKGTSLGKEEK